MARSNAAYDLSLFDTYDYGTAAPVLEPLYEPEEIPALPVPKPKKKKSHAVSQKAKQATRLSTLRTLRLMAVVCSVFCVISAAIYLNVTLDEKARQIARVETAISEARSENIRLTSTLEGIVSIDRIESYATNVLGMVKLETYKITYLESEDDNQVVVSGGKSYDDGGTLSAKIKGAMEYIF